MLTATEKQSLIEDSQHLFIARSHPEPFRRDPVIIHAGEGLTVTDVDGNTYIDALSGIWVVNIGHGNPAVTEAMTEQLQRLTFSWPAGTLNEPAIRLARLLSNITPPELTTVRLANSGSEATELALRLTRQYFRQTGQPRKVKVISRHLSWHGSTLGALSMGGMAPWKAPFAPLLGECLHVPPPYCYRCPYGLRVPACDLTCARVIERVIEWEDPDTVAALIVDPVMISGGILVPPNQYLHVLREICDRNEVLLIFDEVITGFGRTGQMFAMDTFSVTPDVAVMAKGMSGGYAPLAGIIASESIADAFWGSENGFASGHTFGGNPLSATAGIANIEQIQERGLVQRAGQIGGYLQERGQSLRELAMVGDVRGVGLILGVEFVADRDSRDPFPAGIEPGLKVQSAAMRRGMLIRANPHWVALAPPIVASETDIDRMLKILEASIEEIQSEFSLG